MVTDFIVSHVNWSEMKVELVWNFEVNETKANFVENRRFLFGN